MLLLACENFVLKVALSTFSTLQTTKASEE